MENQIPKEVLKRVEIIAGIVFITGLVFKYVLQFPFAGPMLIVGGGSLATVYATGGVELLKNKTSTSENKFLLMAAGLAISIGLIGIMFKLMFWPNAMNMIIVANIALPMLIGAAIWLKTNTNKTTEGDYSSFLLRTLVVYAFVVLLYFIPNSTLIALQHRGDDEMIRLKTQSYDHPENKEYRKQLNDYMIHKRGYATSNDSIK